MSVNYNDGKWHGWNGGECPVHPETVVECWTNAGIFNYAPARMFDWRSRDEVHGKIAFRVIKEHKESERTWSRCVEGATYRNVELKFINGVAHVREVLE